MLISQLVMAHCTLMEHHYILWRPMATIFPSQPGEHRRRNEQHLSVDNILNVSIMNRTLIDTSISNISMLVALMTLGQVCCIEWSQQQHKKYSSILYTLQSLSFIQSNCFECVNWNRIDCNCERKRFFIIQMNQVNRRIVQFNLFMRWTTHLIRTVFLERYWTRTDRYACPHFIRIILQSDNKIINSSLCARAFCKCFDGPSSTNYRCRAHQNRSATNKNIKLSAVDSFISMVERSVENKRSDKMQ